MKETKIHMVSRDVDGRKIFRFVHLVSHIQRVLKALVTNLANVIGCACVSLKSSGRRFQVLAHQIQHGVDHWTRSWREKGKLWSKAEVWRWKGNQEGVAKMPQTHLPRKEYFSIVASGEIHLGI